MKGVFDISAIWKDLFCSWNGMMKIDVEIQEGGIVEPYFYPFGRTGRIRLDGCVIRVIYYIRLSFGFSRNDIRKIIIVKGRLKGFNMYNRGVVFVFKDQKSTGCLNLSFWPISYEKFMSYLKKKNLSDLISEYEPHDPKHE